MKAVVDTYKGWELMAEFQPEGKFVKAKSWTGYKAGETVTLEVPTVNALRELIDMRTSYGKEDT